MTAEELVTRYGAMVYNLALRLAGNPADAQDIAQDALVRGVRSLESFRGEADHGTWLYRIAVNVWKNRVRGETRRGSRRTDSLDAFVQDGEAPALQVPAPEPPLEAGLEADESKAAVEAALAGLDPEDRAILVLRDLDDRSYEEIAEVLELPLGTVKSRIYRAREAVRAKLRPFLEGKKA